MEVANLFENKEKNKIYGLTGNIDLTTNNTNYRIVTPYKFNKASDFLNSEKANLSLKMVMLDETYLNKKSTELSESEIKSINLAKALIDNKDYIVLDYFEKGLSDIEKDNYKRLFKKLTNEYNKTIIIFTNDLTFIWDIAELIIFADKDGVINTSSKNDISSLVKEVDIPEITKFIELMRNKGIKVENYKDRKDLLKAIYRIKEKE